MKQDQSDGRITLHQGDCLDVMPTLEAGSVDLILADLPYGTTVCKWDSIIPLEPLWACYKRLLKPRGAVVLTASQPFTTTLISSNREWFKYVLVWNKRLAGNPFLAKYQPLKVHEDVCVFAQGGQTYNPQMRTGQMKQKGGGYSKLWDVECSTSRSDQYYPTSVLEFSNGDRYGKTIQHPTQKPVALMEYLIRTYSNAGDLVLDNTFGSCTTGVACLNTGRRFIGIERDAGYFAIAEQRLAADRQPSLWDGAA